MNVRQLFFALVLAALPQAAFAQDAADEPAPVESPAEERVAWNGTRVSLRFTSAPLSMGASWGQNGRLGLGTAPIVEVEASLTLSNPWTFELMGQWLLGTDGYTSHGGGLSARVGYSIPVHMNRTRRSGFLVPLLGYGYARRPDLEVSEGHDRNDETHAVEATLAYDYFSGWRNAFTLRALVGYDVVLGSKPESWRMRHGLRVGLLMGVSLRSLGSAGEPERARARPRLRVGGARFSMRFTSSPLLLEYSDRDNKIDHHDIGIVELSLTLPSRWTFELAMNFMYAQRAEATGLGGTGRVGYSIPLASSQSGALSAFLVPLAGYRYARRPHDVVFGATNDTHSAQLGAALDLLVGRGSALSLRLFGAYEYAFISEYFFELNPSGYDISEPMTYSLQAGLLVGFTLGGIGRR